QHISETPVSLAILRPDLPPLLVDLVHRLLGKKPEDRPQSAREVLREIRKIQEGIAGGTASMATSELPETEEPYETTASAPPEWTPRSSPAESRSKRPWLVPIAGASVMLAIIGGAVIGMMLRDDTHTRATATLSTATQRVDALKELQLEREKALIRNVEETRYYQRDPEKPFDFLANTDRYPQGIRARAELLSFYMDKLADEGMARKMKIFVEEEANARVAPEPYRCIGIIGQAMVLATEGKARESYEHLEKAIIAKNNSNVKRIILNSFLRVPDLVEVMLFTLRLNEKNMPVPASLQSVKEELEKASKAGPGERGRPKK
ncbi:MAG TPA: hypothetical protein PKA06_11605, partial [Gemmatales bacterium]|nr:hypothetical protein [Gemmatales bacterium]